MAQVLGLPTGSIRVPTADGSPEARAVGCATPPKPWSWTRLPVSCAPVHAAAQQVCTEAGVCGPTPIASIFGATCGTDWGLPARSNASDTLPAPIFALAQRHSRFGLCAGHPRAAQHGPESVSSLSASSDELESMRAESGVATQPSQPVDIATDSNLAVPEPGAGAHAVAGNLSLQRCAAAGNQDPPADWQARRELPPVSLGQPPQELAQPSDMDR